MATADRDSFINQYRVAINIPVASAAVFFSGVEDRLSSPAEPAWIPAAETLELVRAKIAHCRARDRMSARFFARLPDVVRETLNRGYWRFSYGTRSLLQDLLLR